MKRLLQHPDLNWRDDGTPVATAHDDIYFSVEDGLSETQAVFLDGCNLPQAWAGKSRFTVAETGFGTGLNFLALWRLWVQHRPVPDAQLHFVSFEGFPLTQQTAARALSAWPELQGYASKLLSRWPGPVRGVRQLSWPEAGVTLTLHLGDIEEMLPASQFIADAWFLDGFSPSKNEDMWGAWIYPEMAARSRHGACLGTFTVAGAVRRGLREAGLEVERVPGHGRKRQRLEARFAGKVPQTTDIYGIRPADSPAKRIAIVGAGIAGAATARRLADMGAQVTIYETGSAPALHASGNPLGLVMPRLDAADTVQARLLIDAYLSARDFYRNLPGVTETDVRQPPKDEADKARHAKLLSDPPLPLEDLEALADGGLLHKRALIVSPVDVVEALLKGLALKTDMPADQLSSLCDDYDAVIWANGMKLSERFDWLNLVPKLGQVDFISDGPEAPSSAVASGTYAIAVGPQRLWGATFEHFSGSDPQTSEAAKAENLDGLSRLSPYWIRQAKEGDVQSRAALRATTSDRLPVIGAVPDEAAVLDAFAGLRTGRMPDVCAPLLSGQYMVGGLGARGFTFAPWAGQIIAGQVLGSPAAASIAGLEAISPMRLIIRRIKRGR